MAITTLFFTKYLTSTIGDISSNQLPVTKSGTPTISTVTPSGTTGNSSLFTGNSNDFYYITDIYASVFPKQAQFGTFECWFNLTQISTRQTLFCKGNTSQQQFALEVGTDNKITFYSQTGLTVSSSTTVALNTWYHVAVTVGAGGAKIWVNGVGQNTASGILSDFTDSFYIGVNKTNTSSYTRPLFGYIANVRIYSGKLYTQNFTPTFYLPTLENTYTLSYDPDVFNQVDVGIYINSRENKLDVCQKLANSIGGHLVTDIDGNFKLIQITNGIGQTPKYILTDRDILERSLQIGNKLDLEAAVKIGYCKNWTIQESGLANGLPAESISLFARPYFYASDVDYVALENYNQSAEPVAKETLLITDADSQAEATRQLNLKKVSRFIYTVTCYSHMLLVELGDYIQISHPYRFGLIDKIGTVVSINRDWLNGRVTLSILVVGEPGDSYTISNLNNPQDVVSTNITTGETPVTPASALVLEYTVPQFLANQSTAYVELKPVPTYSGLDIAYGNGKFVLVTGSVMTAEILTSTDNGSTWTNTYTNTNIGSLLSITYGNGIFVATGLNNNVVISTDGINWTLQSLGTNTVSNMVYKVIYGNGVFVAIRLNDTGSNPTSIFTSTNGITWVSRYTGAYFYTRNTVIGSNRFLLNDNTDQYLISTDSGITWSSSSVNLQGFAIQTSMAYGNNTYVVIGQAFGFYNSSPNVATSTDGITWTYRTNLTSTTLSSSHPIVFDTTDNLFLVSNYNASSIVKSSDGINWTTATTGSITSIRQGVGGNSVYIDLIDNDPSFEIAVSTNNRNTWTIQPITTGLSNQLSINWGDGTSETIMYNPYSYSALYHTYTIAGTYEVTVTGTAIGFQSHWCLTDVKSWGSLKITDLSSTFTYVDMANISATNTPDLSICVSMDNTFSDAWYFNGAINNWDVSNVISMSETFAYAYAFNQPLNSWNVSNVRDMSSMFNSATEFNQPLNNWNVSNVTNMNYMFADATNFNQSINSWNVGSVIDMAGMFYFATNFNQALNNWNVSKVTTMEYMFYSATNFNQALNNWNVSKVTSMEYMFYNASAFAQNLSSWNVTNVAYRAGFSTGAGALTPPNWVI